MKSQYFSFDQFDKALETLIQLLENKPVNKPLDHTDRVTRPETPRKSQVSLSTTAHEASNVNITCQFCDQGHYANKCPTYLTVEQRRSALRRKNLCMRCSQKGHYANVCGAKLSCFVCKGNHWIGLCPKTCKQDTNTNYKTSSHAYPSQVQKTNSGNSKQTVTNKRVVVQTSSDTTGGVALPTALFKVYPVAKGGSSAPVRCFFDSGSQKSYVHPKVLEMIGVVPKQHITINLAAFGHEAEPVNCPVVKLKLSLGNRVATVRLLVTDRVQMELYTPGLKDTISMLKKNKVHLADRTASDKLKDVAVVLGADSMPKFIRGTRKIGNINLLDSSGGYVVYGALPFGEASDSAVNQSVCCARVTIQDCDVDTSQVTEVPAPEVSKLWEMDVIGIQDEKFTPGERDALQKFTDTIEYHNGKY